MVKGSQTARFARPSMPGWLTLLLLAGCRHEPQAEGTMTADPCPGEWSQAPTVDPAIAVPDGGGRVVLHAGAAGSQNYTCARASVDGGPGYGWTFVGPEATLNDCRGTSIGSHFASDGGATAPEWQLAGGDYVVGHKLSAFTAAGAVPWLLIGTDRHGGGGPLAGSRYVQRVGTHGGVSPSVGCDANALGTTQKVPYTADYFFFGP
jgi:hypothetical protein